VVKIKLKILEVKRNSVIIEMPIRHQAGKEFEELCEGELE